MTRPHAERDARQVAFLAHAIWSSTARSSRCTSSAKWGMPRRIYTYAPTWAGISGTSSKASAPLCLGGFVPAVFHQYRLEPAFNGERAPADPWDARTLEWSIPSPPPIYNFARSRRCISRDAFWVRSMATSRRSGLARSTSTSDSTTRRRSEDIAGIHMPAPSLYPIHDRAAFSWHGLGMLVGWYRLVFLGAACWCFGAISMSFEYRELGRG